MIMMACYLIIDTKYSWLSLSLGSTSEDSNNLDRKCLEKKFFPVSSK